MGMIVLNFAKEDKMGVTLFIVKAELTGHVKCSQQHQVICQYKSIENYIIWTLYITCKLPYRILVILYSRNLTTVMGIQRNAPLLYAKLN